MTTGAAPVITIDGPSGSGKGTIGLMLAQELGFHFLDSGALYRVLALAARHRGIAVDDTEGLAVLAAHMDVNAIDLAGVAGDPDDARRLEESAAENLKRVIRPPEAEPTWTREPGLDRITAFLETKTVWHPKGL